uniref:SFRICE_005449 n=1 Tax=Spodoptera frugiperda TaxID=7108 RepID=A0A2H1VEA0_SPOFR
MVCRALLARDKDARSRRVHPLTSEWLFFISRAFRKFLGSSIESGIVPSIWQKAHPLLQGTYNINDEKWGDEIIQLLLSSWARREDEHILVYSTRDKGQIAWRGNRSRSYRAITAARDQYVTSTSTYFLLS